MSDTTLKYGVPMNDDWSGDLPKDLAALVDWKLRAEKAERERDEALRERDEWADAIRSVAPGAIPSPHAAKYAIEELYKRWKDTQVQRDKARGDAANLTVRLLEVQDELTQVRRERGVAADAANQGTWLWSDTDPNELVSMGDDMIISMRAKQLRALTTRLSAAEVVVEAGMRWLRAERAVFHALGSSSEIVERRELLQSQSGLREVLHAHDALKDSKGGDAGAGVASPVDSTSAKGEPIDPRPRCISCGRRWTPAEGEDATQLSCQRCVPTQPHVLITRAELDVMIASLREIAAELRREKWRPLTADPVTWPEEGVNVLWHWWNPGDVNSGFRVGSKVQALGEEVAILLVTEATHWKPLQLPKEPP